VIKTLTTRFLRAASLIAASLAYAAETPTLHQVYEAAQSGKMAEAQDMIQQVLKEHPNSAKAHFVDAELLAKAGQLANAKEELSTAERLEPGLPFAKPQAVQALKARISGTTQNIAPMTSAQPAHEGFPWGLMLLGIGLIALIAIVVRALANRNNAPVIYPGNNPNGASYPNGQSGYAPMAPQASGMGGGLMSSLATGAALGAGVVAGEALAHHFIDGNKPEPTPAPPAADTGSSFANAGTDNMGGMDFGIADNSSWDDGASMADISGGDDWT
jgi:tetratricopeptide (TPR) repeat protein